MTSAVLGEFEDVVAAPGSRCFAEGEGGVGAVEQTDHGSDAKLSCASGDSVRQGAFAD